MSPPRPRALAGRIALVTGAASGIGEACARRFADEGAIVMVSDIDLARGAAVATQIGGEFHALDVTDETAWTAAVARITARHGGLDVLVNNAGAGTGGGLSRETLEAHRRVMDINVTGTWLGIRAALPAFGAKGGGAVVNISSIDGLVGVEGLSSYVGSKFAVTGLTRSLALELGHANIRVNSVHPGITATPMVLKNAGATMARLEAAVARQPIARMAEPAEIAAAVLFLASSESSYVTGASLVVDGGHIAGPWRDPL
ncbi:MAG: glucose 1-dehydrogenase [Sphingomonadales bacterium]|nr:glucose 1-dehydrogenase [Sphingomonadales bacterium]